ncbi:MAG: Phenylalanyl-tRNA synthetase alpha chain [uncultured Solirubrobacterales bacterium]|uniref:Phenylalanine--tRNA ligase alpha subunit n=1 Tax=uncultured Solirubrobacterales bacterium TaxID=768556 RepID=A0A6J4TDU6_9ACTN|nr:MAG: Phenylalanyl-tRNA synthetase alpha chain [uncultured Solirubrobacterales bacterium]
MAEPAAKRRLEELSAEAEAALGAARSSAELEELRVRYLGRRSELTATLRSIRELPAPERGPVGQAANSVRVRLEELIAERGAALEATELDRRLEQDRLDVTLPGDPPLPAGHLHLVTQIRRELEDVFVGLGFEVLEGPEVEYEYYNFTALNHPPSHPARLPGDTFYLSDDVLLRTHTSPMQIRAMESRPPPIYVVVPGRVYRPDTPDATHVPMFHQLEGLAIDEGVTLADLKGTLREFARAMFGPGQEVRLRPGYFPFTEPSVEVDVSCFACHGTGAVGSERCPTCKGEAWIEILGAGMVDPNVLGYVAESGYDPERVQGFAFGMGIERIAMLRYGVPDLRMLWENDVRLLEQFGA